MEKVVWVEVESIIMTTILHNHCFQFPQGITVVPREIEDSDYVKFFFFLGGGGVNKVHYGLCDNGG